MDWLQVITIILSLAGFIGGLLHWFRTDLKTDISRIESDIKGLENEVNAVGNKVDADMRAQTARTDKLYEMFVQLQRENNDLIKAVFKLPKTDP